MRKEGTGLREGKWPKDSQQVKKRKEELDPVLLSLSLCSVAFFSSAPG